MTGRVIIVFSVLVLSLSFYQCSRCDRGEKEPEPEVEAVARQIQEPVVAGGFYPLKADDLRAMVLGFLDAAEVKEITDRPLGFMVPHAGYIYSGPVAAYVYKVIGNTKTKRFVVMAPSHRGYAEMASVLDKDYYRTPLGLVKIDRKKVRELMKKEPWISYEPSMYAQEHSLEVQLPFLQTVAGEDIEIVPIVIGTPRLEFAKKLAAVLDEVFADDDVIFIASSDMSHRYSYDVANRMDQLALSRILALDDSRLEDDFLKLKAQCCGAGPVFTLMSLFKKRGGHKVEVLDYRNSGDTAGNKASVVGYGAVAFLMTADEKPDRGADREPEPEGTRPLPPEDYDLTLEEKRDLMRIARETVETYVLEDRLPEVRVRSEKLMENGAAFVTLKKQGQLRGCIGHLVARIPLYLCVRDVAASAAKHDRRFQPVAPEELHQIEYEVSVLTPMEVVEDLDEIMVGRDGLEMEAGMRRGVLLPQVPLENKWTKDEFLSHTCTKSGMDPECWKTGRVKISRFQALVFSEEELEQETNEKVDKSGP